jgi:hypothetical protein
MGGDGLTFRIFTNDRGKKAGVPMYSALCPLSALNAQAAEHIAARDYRTFGPPKFAPVKAIEWPATSQESKDWLAKHV